MKQLVFMPHGSVQLLASKGKIAKVLWSSDNDEAFAELADDVLDPEIDDDVDLVTDYLIDEELLEENEDIEIDAQYLSDEKGPGNEDDDDDDDGDYADHWNPDGRLAHVAK